MAGAMKLWRRCLLSLCLSLYSLNSGVTSNLSRGFDNGTSSKVFEVFCDSGRIWVRDYALLREELSLRCRIDVGSAAKLLHFTGDWNRGSLGAFHKNIWSDAACIHGLKSGDFYWVAYDVLNQFAVVLDYQIWQTRRGQLSSNISCVNTSGSSSISVPMAGRVVGKYSDSHRVIRYQTLVTVATGSSYFGLTE